MTPDTVCLTLPEIMSVVKLLEYAYSAGLMNPTDPLPSFMRAAFKLDIIPAINGVEADDPPARYLSSPVVMR